MTDTRTDALPCPLCGRQATVAQIKAGIEWWSVECEAERGDGCGLNIARSTQASAIAAWNTRPPKQYGEGDGGFLTAKEREEIRQMAARPSTPPSDDGYKQWFYELSDAMDIVASVKSPKQVWETQMLPRLKTLLQAPATDRKRQVVHRPK